MITIFDNTGNIYPYEIMNFPEGESFVKLDTVFVPAIGTNPINILWKYENDQELFVLGLIFDIIEHNGGNVENLYIPYFPHARQDRNTSNNQPFSLMVFAKLLKSILSVSSKEVKIYSLDVHSNVLIDVMQEIMVQLADEYKEINNDAYKNFINLNSSDLIEHYQPNLFSHINCIICPDKGAKTRANQWAEKLNLPVLYCEKTRDPSTGKLSNPVIVNEENLRNDWTYLLVDDIGTGFGTHIQLANFINSKRELDKNKLPQDASTAIEIFVSHAGFSNGIQPVLDVFDRIYTTNSLVKGYNKIVDLLAKNDPINSGCVFVVDVEKVFNIPNRKKK